jgi:hypothetical protein
MSRTELVIANVQHATTDRYMRRLDQPGQRHGAGVIVLVASAALGLIYGVAWCWP